MRKHEEVEEAMENAYLKAFIRLPRFERTASFSTWLTRILINECLMRCAGEKSLPE